MQHGFGLEHKPTDLEHALVKAMAELTSLRAEFEQVKSEVLQGRAFDAETFRSYAEKLIEENELLRMRCGQTHKVDL